MATGGEIRNGPGLAPTGRRGRDRIRSERVGGLGLGVANLGEAAGQHWERVDHEVDDAGSHWARYWAVVLDLSNWAQHLSNGLYWLTFEIEPEPIFQNLWKKGFWTCAKHFGNRIANILKIYRVAIWPRACIAQIMYCPDNLTGTYTPTWQYHGPWPGKRNPCSLLQYHCCPSPSANSISCNKLLHASKLMRRTSSDLWFLDHANNPLFSGSHMGSSLPRLGRRGEGERSDQIRSMNESQPAGDRRRSRSVGRGEERKGRTRSAYFSIDRWRSNYQLIKPKIASGTLASSSCSLLVPWRRSDWGGRRPGVVTTWLAAHRSPIKQCRPRTPLMMVVVVVALAAAGRSCFEF